MAEKDRVSCAAAPATASGWSSVEASTRAAERRAQRDLVSFVTRDAEPNEAMRALAEEYRRDVAEGRIKST